MTPTGITQNCKDLLASPEISNIFETSDFILMLNQASGDRKILAKALNISPHRLSYVTNSNEGEGLLFFGEDVIKYGVFGDIQVGMSAANASDLLPITEYIQNTFGMHYTQDESYYILDSDDNAVVYLGVKEGIDKEEMLADLHSAQNGGEPFNAEKYVNAWPAKKHDHFLIPAGTIHCSGNNTMVLEISASVYLFTFKLWDWARIGLDGKPRPVHLAHGEKVIQWDRTTTWVEENLVNRVEVLAQEQGYKEESTGLHEREFIETRRYELTKRQKFDNMGSVNVCNVVSGDGAIVSSTDGSFEPYEVHYVETFIIPATIKSFYLQPLNQECTIIRAWVRG